MKKQFILPLLCVVIAGCAYEGKKIGEYLDDPGSIIQDPHFANYKEQRDALELQYLGGEITYADYVQKAEELDAKYNREVKQRNEKLSDMGNYETLR